MYFPVHPTSYALPPFFYPFLPSGGSHLQLAFESDEESGRTRFSVEDPASIAVTHKRPSNSHRGTSAAGSNSSAAVPAARRNSADAAAAKTSVPCSPDAGFVTPRDDTEPKAALAWWYPTPADEIEHAAEETTAMGLEEDGGSETIGGDGITVYPPRESSSALLQSTLESTARRERIFNPLSDLDLLPGGCVSGGGKESGHGGDVDAVDDGFSLLTAGCSAAARQSINIIEQQMNDLAAEGDLLFGPCDISEDGHDQSRGGHSVNDVDGGLANADGRRHDINSEGADNNGNNHKSSAWAYHLFGLPLPPSLTAIDSSSSELIEADNTATSNDSVADASSDGLPSSTVGFSLAENDFAAGGIGGSFCVAASPWAGGTSGWGTWGPSPSVN